MARLPGGGANSAVNCFVSAPTPPSLPPPSHLPSQPRSPTPPPRVTAPGGNPVSGGIPSGFRSELVSVICACAICHVTLSACVKFQWPVCACANTASDQNIRIRVRRLPSKTATSRSRHVTEHQTNLARTS